MKLLIAISALILAVSGRIYNDPSIQKYAKSAEAYQSGLEQQQSGLYSSQSSTHAAHEVANHRPEGEKTAKILGFHAEIDGHKYRYAYETENGIKAQEEGNIEKGTSAHGAFSYKGDDGHEYTIHYTADENGFRPSGDHLPTPPPIPEEILKSLEKNAKDEAAGIFDDGKYRHHQEQEHHHQQIEGGHQSLEQHSSGQSGVDLSYYALAAAQEANSGHQESLGHSSTNVDYSSPSSNYGASSGHQSSFSQGADSGYGSSSGYVAGLGYKSSSGLESNLGHQYIAHDAYQASSGNEANLDYQASSGNKATLGYQSSSNEASLGVQYSMGHGAMNHQAALGHGSDYSRGNYVHRAPSGFASATSQPGITGHLTGHSSLSYLPPSSHSGYHSQQ